MKKISLISIIIVLYAIIYASSFDITGDLRTRVAANNDSTYIDSRFTFGFESKLATDLLVAWRIEIGDLIWGKEGGQINTRGVNVKTTDLYLDYRINAIASNLRIGQQWWADHRSLILDNNFSGIMLYADGIKDIKANLGYIYNTTDEEMTKDHHVFLADLYSETPFSWGLLTMYGKDQNRSQKVVTRLVPAENPSRDSDTQPVQDDMVEEEIIAKTLSSNVLFMPYFSIPIGLFNIDTTILAEYQNLIDADDQWVMGAAVKPEISTERFSLGADILAVQGDGISTLSSYYMNGLYLYGYGIHHDTVTNYAHLGYEFSSESENGFLSAIGNGSYTLSETLKFFTAGGYLSDLKNNKIGAEINGGFEYSPITDMLSLAVFGAIGFPEARYQKNGSTTLLGAEVLVTF